MNGWIIALVVGIIGIGGAYNQDYLPQSANEFIEDNILGSNYINPDGVETDSVDDPEPIVESVVVDDEVTEDDTELEELQQEAINESESLSDNVRITYGRISEIRDCKSDIDCLRAYPDAGLSIQCSDDGTCYKYADW